MPRKNVTELRFHTMNDEFDTLVVDLEIAQKDLVMRYWLDDERSREEEN